jgi:hypothetical protein
MIIIKIKMFLMVLQVIYWTGKIVIQWMLVTKEMPFNQKLKGFQMSPYDSQTKICFRNVVEKTDFVPGQKP